MFEDEAIRHLKPLVLPTFDSFRKANEIAARERADFAMERESCLRPMLGSKDGNAFWVYFAGLLDREYAGIAGVQRVEGNHALSSAWDIDGRIRLHLKRDVAAFDFNQLAFDVGEASGPHAEIVLSWTSHGAERVAPRFVHSAADGHVIWSRSVASLLVPEEADAVVTPPRRGVTVKSAREKRVGEDTTTGQA